MRPATPSPARQGTIIPHEAHDPALPSPLRLASLSQFYSIPSLPIHPPPIFSASLMGSRPPSPPAPTSVLCMSPTSCSGRATPSLPCLSLSPSCYNPLTYGLGPEFSPQGRSRAFHKPLTPLSGESSSSSSTVLHRPFVFSAELRPSKGAIAPYCRRFMKCFSAGDSAPPVPADTVKGQADSVLSGT